MHNDSLQEIGPERPDRIFQENAERRVHDAWEWLLKTRQGRVILYDLLQVCEFGLSSWAGSTETTLVNSGKQIVGEHINQMMSTVYPEAYTQMLKEAREDQEYDRSANDASARGDSSTNSGASSGDTTSE